MREKQSRKNVNLIHNEVQRITKTNNWMEAISEKQWKVMKA